MKKLIPYYLVLVAIITACEDVYLPKIETRENVMVVEATISLGNENNVVRLYESSSYNSDKNSYPGIPGAQVTIIDDQENQFNLQEVNDGIFPVEITFDPNTEYKIKIQHNGDTYESSFEPVPPTPELDTIYGIPEEKVIVESGETNVNDFRKKAGVQLYADITHEKEFPYFRFSGRKILQYTYSVPVGEVEETMYGWTSYLSQQVFNIAAPPEYSGSTDIKKHPAWFLEQTYTVDTGQSFAGWILILYQHGLSKSGYNYYEDLNNQLESEGRLFDPLYIQARSNISCISDKNKLVLGNFEISTVTEHRYFVRYYGGKTGYVIKPIPYFYDIPWSGEQLGVMPDFWEYVTKPYPDE